MIGIEMSINHIKNTELPIKVVVAEYDRLFFSESNNSLKQYSNGATSFVRKNYRKTQTKTFEMHVHTTKLSDLDHFTKWITSENVEFVPNTALKRAYTAYKFNVTSQAKQENIYIFQVSVEYSYKGWSISEKVAKNGVGKLVFENHGTAETYPTYQFTATQNYRMIALTHPNGYVVQYGYETGNTVIRINDVVKFDSENNLLTINGERKYINPASRIFAIGAGTTTEIGVSCDGYKEAPKIQAFYKECWL